MTEVKKTTDMLNLDIIMDPAIIVDDDKIITRANNGFLEKFGIKNKQINQISCKEACNSHLCGTKDCPVDKAVSAHEKVEAEYIYKENEGKVSYYKSTARPLEEAGSTLVILRDITSEKETEDRLNQLETNFNVLPTPVIEIDDSFTITYINPAGAGVAGKNPEDVIGVKCYDIFKTPHCKTEKCACAQAMKTDSVVTEETIARPQDDIIIPIKYTGAPVKDAKGNVRGALEYVLDVTEEIKQKQASNEKIENLNSIPTPIISMDTEFNVTYINPAGAEVAGKSPEDVIGSKCYDIFKTPHCRTEKCACARAMKTDSIVTAETIARPKDDVIIPIKYTGAPIKDAKGNIKGVLEYVNDITEESRQRQEANEKVENLNSIPNPIHAIDTNHNLTYINPAGAEILGVTVEEALGKKCYELFKTDRCQTEDCGIKRAMQTGDKITEQTTAHIQEEEMPIRVTSIAIKDAKGNVKGGLEYIEDITAKAKVDKLISSSTEEVNNMVLSSVKKMEKASTSMGEMDELVEKEVGLLDESSNWLDDMLNSVTEMVTLTTDSNEMSSSVARDAETGKKAGAEAGKKLKALNESMQASNQMVANLAQQLDKISGFVDIIKDIASQTNLLAFNAAIEAARAGDAGRGFAVVADEVRKLAENSSGSAVDIAKIVKQIEEESKETTSAMKEGMKMLDEGGEVINEALMAMDKISEGILTISNSVGEMDSMADVLKEKGLSVKDQVAAVVDSSKKNKVSIEDVNSSIEETVETLKKLAERSTSLQKAVDEL